jgi:c-di-GMP-binding flagellar brake protein YcgR
LNSREKETKTHYGILNVERRRYPRFNIDVPIEYYRIEEPADLRGRVLDISQGGLLIYSSERMDVGERLRLRLFLSMVSEFSTVELLSEVVWVDMRVSEDSGDYRTGVKFVDITPGDMTKLKNFLLSFSQPK